MLAKHPAHNFDSKYNIRIPSFSSGKVHKLSPSSGTILTYDDRTSRNDGRVQEPDRTAKQWNATIHQELFLSKHPSNEPQRPIVQNAELEEVKKIITAVEALKDKISVYIKRRPTCIDNEYRLLTGLCRRYQISLDNITNEYYKQKKSYLKILDKCLSKLERSMKSGVTQ